MTPGEAHQRLIAAGFERMDFSEAMKLPSGHQVPGYVYQYRQGKDQFTVAIYSDLGFPACYDDEKMKHNRVRTERAEEWAVLHKILEHCT